MKKIRTPDFLENLYRDMRDRRLLFPAIGLVVALLAVPVLLTSHSSPTTTSPATSGGSDDSASAAVPAVVTQELGVTNYRKRLDRLQSKNPFKQQYTDAPASAAVQATSTGATSSTVTPPLDTGTTSGSTSSSTSSTSSVSGGTSAVTSSPPDSSTTSSSGSPGTHRTKPRPRLYAWRASVKVGEANHLKERPEVQRLAMLPSEGKPIVTFMGASEEGDQALFFVSRDVDSVKGDGRCLPNHSSCQFVVLKPGDKASFDYAPNGKRYNLVLVDVHAVAVDAKLRKKVSGDAQPQAKLPLLGPG
jgi:hypothetical protein